MGSEKDLMQAYVTARTEKERIEAQLAEAKERLEKVETELVKFMEDTGSTSTAKYAEFGRFQVCKPSIRVSINPDKEKVAFDYLKSIGEGSLIRETIHWKSLSSIIGQKIEENQSLPDCFNYYFQNNVKWERP